MQMERLSELAQPVPALSWYTRAVDRSAAETGVRLAYAAGGLPPPSSIVWCDSPLDLARRWKSRSAASGRNVRRLVVDRVCAHTLRMARQTKTGRGRWSGRQRPRSVSALAAMAVTGVVDHEAQRVRLGAVARVRYVLACVKQMARREGWAGFRASGISPYDFGWLDSVAREGLALQEEDRLDGLKLLIGNAGWIVPHEAVCWLSERPVTLACDDRGRLHSSRGPALAYRDGWTYYAWKGIPVPGSCIDAPERITLHMIDTEPDIFVRRCLIEILTPKRFVALGGANLVMQDSTGILWRRSWPRGDAWAAVEVVNGTSGPDGQCERYFLQVPPELQTARAAVAWTYGMSEFQYAHLGLRT